MRDRCFSRGTARKRWSCTLLSSETRPVKKIPAFTNRKPAGKSCGAPCRLPPTQFGRERMFGVKSSAAATEYWRTMPGHGTLVRRRLMHRGRTLPVFLGRVTSRAPRGGKERYPPSASSGRCESREAILRDASDVLLVRSNLFQGKAGNPVHSKMISSITTPNLLRMTRLSARQGRAPSRSPRLQTLAQPAGRCRPYPVQGQSCKTGSGSVSHHQSACLLRHPVGDLASVLVRPMPTPHGMPVFLQHGAAHLPPESSRSVMPSTEETLVYRVPKFQTQGAKPGDDQHHPRHVAVQRIIRAKDRDAVFFSRASYLEVDIAI